MSTSPVAHLPRPDGGTLAYRLRAGRVAGPTVVWLGGFLSDMEGTKATALDAAMAERRRAFLRFDYAGHGLSPDRAGDAHVGGWRADTLQALDQLTQGPLLLVGSSMGAWMALLALKARPERVAGLVLIAPAPDFTERLLWPSLSDAERARIEAGETVTLPPTTDRGAFPLTKGFFDDGARQSVLDTAIPCAGPVRILHGLDDPDVPWTHGLAVAEAIGSPNLTLTLIKGGDHRLSTPPDIARLIETVEEALCVIASGKAG